jgi:dCMP deaminase
MSRVSWDVYAMNLAIASSLRSEDPFTKVGACALSYDNRVLGVAYNGLQSKKIVHSSFWNSREERRPYIIHAETNILSLFKRDECKLLAVTLLPCECCALQIAAWNIPRVIFLNHYDHISAKKSIDIFNFYNIEVEKVTV